MATKVTTLDHVLSFFHDHMTLMFGGFGGVGTPPTIIQGIVEKNIKHLHLIGNDAGFPHIGIGKVISGGQAASLITSHIGSNPIAGQLMTDGLLEVEFCPQGNLVERIRAGGVGLGGILLDVGVDSIVEEKKQTVIVDGKKYLIERPLTAEVSIVYGEKADTLGNIVYDKSARNTNPLVAMAGDITIVEVKEIVEAGSLHPEEIVTPGIFVDYVIASKGVNWKWAWEK